MKHYTISRGTSMRRASLLLLALLSLLATASAQSSNTDIESIGGTSYVVAFPDTTKNLFDARYPNVQYGDKAILFIYSAVDNTITIRGRGYSTQQTVVGQKFLVVDLSGGTTIAPTPIVIDHCKPVDNTFRIEAEQPVVVYQYLVTKFGTEAWTPLPIDAWDTEYYAAAHPGEVGSDISPGGEFDYNHRNKMFPAEILVVAAYDDTHVTIVPNGQVHTNCSPTDITLKAGEAYQIQSYVDTLTANVGTPQPDFAGSRIFSTKPVGVYSGNTRAQLIDENVGLGKNIFKNMLMEALTPVAFHGTEFVYMPTWDSRRPTGAPDEDMSKVRKAEIVRVYGTSDGQTNGSYVDSIGSVAFPGPIARGMFVQIRHTPNRARVYHTDKPAQAMMSSVAIVRYAGTTQGFGGYIGAAYDGYGGYMTGLAPREKWASFAPYYVSTHPAGMEHYINVVTDTSHRNDVLRENGTPFAFTRPIDGTDLIWGSMAVQAGVDHWLVGRNGAKFWGVVYGGMIKGGHEEFRPGRARGRGDAPPALADGGDDDDAAVLHPSEYEEYLSIAYGYPLPSLYLVSGPGDSLGVTTRTDCAGMTIAVRALNSDPVGLSSVRLENGINARIVTLRPFPINRVIADTIVLGPINPQQDASASVVIADRSGRITRVAFNYYAERIAFDTDPRRSDINWGIMTPGTSIDSSRTITNPLGRPLTIRRIRLANGNPAFTITSPTALPMTLSEGGSIKVAVTANPPAPDQVYIDTVVIELECATARIPLKAETSNPCVNVGDLDFGTLEPGQSRTLPLRICNDGGGQVTFNNPSGGLVLEWLLRNFTVSAADLDLIKRTTLNRGDCVTINVTFTSTTVGIHRDTVRVWASTRNCRDTSVWTAVVTAPNGVAAESSSIAALDVGAPNPFTSETTLRFTLRRADHATIVLYDDRGVRVATLVDRDLAAGEHVIVVDGATLAAGIYHCRLTAGMTSIVRTLVRR
jgi:hypothetical protein